MPGRYNLNCQNRGQKNNRFPGETSSDEWEVLQVKLWILPFEVCIPSIMAAGNSITNAFNASPSRGRSIITVGSTDIDDKQSSFSNYGECGDIFASGRDIKALWIDNDFQTNTISGTSLVSLDVCGVLELLLQSGTTPEEID